MEIRQSSNSEYVKHCTTEMLRRDFLIEDLFISGVIKRVYSHIDRLIIIGAMPVSRKIELGQNLDIKNNLGTNYFLERRELGVFNIGRKGNILVDGKRFEMSAEDSLYIGKGAKEVIFESDDKTNPAKFYALSAPAHKTCKTIHINTAQAKKYELGNDESCDRRILYQYIHPDILESCQLTMGLTQVVKRNVWNTLPWHVHERRMELYLYYDLSKNDVVFHYMGEPFESRHIIVRNEQAVISPSWSIHSGCGISSYKFIWGMVGENQEFTDMNKVAINDMK